MVVCWCAASALSFLMMIPIIQDKALAQAGSSLGYEMLQNRDQVEGPGQFDD
jgi:hypothetical protein